MKKILICKTIGLDSTGIISVLAEKYMIETASSVGEVRTLTEKLSPDIVIFGESFCGSSPTELSKEIKAACNSKILIILSEGRSTPYNTAVNGGDDVIFQPFTDCELITRVNMLGVYEEKNESKIFRTGQMTIDYENCRVYIADRILHLTMLEYKLLCLLSKSCGSPVSYSEITRELWQNTVGNEIQSLRVFVNAIRKKIHQLGDTNEYIQTRMGVGYIMTNID